MPSFPPQAVQLADDVDVLIVKHGVTSFLEKVLQWVEHHCEALNRRDVWESRRRRYFENMDSAHQDDAKPPNDHYLWDDMVVATDEGELKRLAGKIDKALLEDGGTSMASNAPARPIICGYVPPELHSSQRPSADLPLPSLDRPASIQEQYAALCAVRDQILVKDIGVESPHFEHLKSMVENVVGEDRWRILGGYLRDVEADVVTVAEKIATGEPPSEHQDSTEMLEPPKPPEDEELRRAKELWTDLRVWVGDELKGKQQRFMELLLEDTAALLENKAVVKLADIASDSKIDWQSPWDDSFSSMERTLNNKLKQAKKPVKIKRHKNVVQLISVNETERRYVKKPSKTRQK